MKEKVNQLITSFLAWGPIRVFLSLKFPGAKNITFGQVLSTYYTSLSSSRITMRAAAVSFDFFMALFPSVIFLFTLTAYLPIPNFDKLLLETIQDVLPDYTYRTIENTITDIISIQRDGLLSFGFLIALFYATNGTTSLIRSFNALSFVKDSRPAWQTRLLALLLTLIFVFILVLTIIIIIFTHYVLGYLIEKGLIDTTINLDLIKLGEWFTLLIMILLSVSSLYFFGPEPKIRPTFFSPGSIVSTLLIVVLLQLFGIFINQFATFNTVYGSVGALIALMVLINLNALILLAGHELNAVVYHLKRQTTS